MKRNGRPRLDPNERLVMVPVRLLPGTLGQIEQVADTREWPIGKTVRKLVEAALNANLVPPVILPESRLLKTTEVQSLAIE